MLGEYRGIKEQINIPEFQFVGIHALFLLCEKIIIIIETLLYGGGSVAKL